MWRYTSSGGLGCQSAINGGSLKGTFAAATALRKAWVYKKNTSSTVTLATSGEVMGFLTRLPILSTKPIGISLASW